MVWNFTEKTNRKEIQPKKKKLFPKAKDDECYRDMKRGAKKIFEKARQHPKK